MRQERRSTSIQVAWRGLQGRRKGAARRKEVEEARVRAGAHGKGGDVELRMLCARRAYFELCRLVERGDEGQLNIHERKFPLLDRMYIVTRPSSHREPCYGRSYA